ncbi:SGNH/GDSL hydrolase family protein [Desertivirga xinjiangensis]|uniref:SGNH/GDSL hydrolase family protein n=1 Tax=Desertivirga xinjiangensis TaxID=539206 RepID=UPI00210CD2C5|nr:SGNH/GDSL hydrolase family protein [Pedobacter xinjiangensis]
MKQYNITLYIFLLIAVQAAAQQKQIEGRWQKFIKLEDYLQPFWKADTIHDEIVQIIKYGDRTEGTLLFDSRQIVSVRSANLEKTYKKDKDWAYESGKIILPARSNIPFIDKDSLVFSVEKPNWSMKGKTPGTFVLFNEGGYFRTMQIAVTYIAEQPHKWTGPVPVFADKMLPGTLRKLKKKEPFKVVFYGNSIETGANSSGFQNEPPYMPSWPELIVYQLRQTYGQQVQFDNQSVGGMLAQWGSDYAIQRVVPQKPDLVIIGFGMNDGTFNVSPETYRRNVEAIIDKVTVDIPDAEFILIAPMLANPFATQSSIQASYKAELDKLARTGIVVADITGVHQELLKRKSYQDMTGNNVNHPNDYLARWYAQFISGILIK